MKIIHIVGARPNFMKLSPVYRALEQKKVEQIIIHTGQHYSANMSDIFFQELSIPKADINLGVGAGSQAEQVAKMMISLENEISLQKPDLVIVYGDVNSTLAASLVCAKLQIKIAHVESGLRSFDRTMPEEINRIVTDRLSDIFFTTSVEADDNLKKEGVDKNKIFFVGNVMIDTLVQFIQKPLQQNFSTPEKYAVVTLHRPANVDDLSQLQKIADSLFDISSELPIFFPVHPRTQLKLNEIIKNAKKEKNITLLDPLGYIEFINLVKGSAAVITDSGGIQEETTYLNIPCLTLRENTERPITITEGSNTLIGYDFSYLKKCIYDILSGKYKKSSCPKFWDGHAADRIAEVLMKINFS